MGQDGSQKMEGTCGLRHAPVGYRRGAPEPGGDPRSIFRPVVLAAGAHSAPQAQRPPRRVSTKCKTVPPSILQLEAVRDSSLFAHGHQRKAGEKGGEVLVGSMHSVWHPGRARLAQLTTSENQADTRQEAGPRGGRGGRGRGLVWARAGQAPGHREAVPLLRRGHALALLDALLDGEDLPLVGAVVAGRQLNARQEGRTGGQERGGGGAGGK